MRPQYAGLLGLVFGEAVSQLLDVGKQSWGYTLCRTGGCQSVLEFSDHKNWCFVVRYKGTAESSELALDLLGHLFSPSADHRAALCFESIFQRWNGFSELLKACGKLSGNKKWDQPSKRIYAGHLWNVVKRIPVTDRKMLLGIKEVRSRNWDSYNVPSARTPGSRPYLVSYTNDAYMVRDYFATLWTLFPVEPGRWETRHMGRLKWVDGDDDEDDDDDLVEWKDSDLYTSLEHMELCKLEEARRSPGWFQPFLLRDHISPQMLYNMLDHTFRGGERYSTEASRTATRRQMESDPVPESPYIILYWMEDAMKGKTRMTKATFTFGANGASVRFTGVQRAGRSLMKMLRWMCFGNLAHPYEHSQVMDCSDELFYCGVLNFLNAI